MTEFGRSYDPFGLVKPPRVAAKADNAGPAFVILFKGILAKTKSKFKSNHVFWFSEQ